MQRDDATIFEFEADLSAVETVSLESLASYSRLRSMICSRSAQ